MTLPIVILCVAEFAVGAVLGLLWRWRPLFLFAASLFAGLVLATIVGDWSDVPTSLTRLDFFVWESLTIFGYLSITLPPTLCGAFIAYGIRLLVRRTGKPATPSATATNPEVSTRTL